MNISVLAFSGSLRRDSYTTRLLKAFQKQAPAGVNMQIIDIGNLPFINEDLEPALPQSVLDFHEAIQHADAFIFGTPEYNRSYSPVLKNALDWGSRPIGQNKWNKKPVAVLGCSPYALGGFGAVNHLRQVLMYLNTYPLQQPEFYVSGAKDKFDDTGNLTDKGTQDMIEKLWSEFMELIGKVK